MSHHISCQHLSIAAPNWLGDVVLAQAAMYALKQALPDSKISLYGRPWLADLAPYLNLGNAIQTYTSVPADADATVLFRNSFSAAWQAFRSGVKHRYGFRHECRGLLLNHAYTARLNMQYDHHRLYFLDLVEQMGIDTSQQPGLQAPKGDQDAAAQLLNTHGINPERLICIAAGAQFGAAKRYPAASYQYIVQKLADQGWQPVLLGSASEYELSDQICADLKTPYWNAAGATSLRQAIQLLAHTQLLLCNDSGLMHICAGLQRPVVALFGATDPERTSPAGDHVHICYQAAACSPCLARECSVAGQPCMANLEPKKITDICLQALSS